MGPGEGADVMTLPPFLLNRHSSPSYQLLNARIRPLASKTSASPWKMREGFEQRAQSTSCAPCTGMRNNKFRQWGGTSLPADIGGDSTFGTIMSPPPLRSPAVQIQVVSEREELDQRIAEAQRPTL